MRKITLALCWAIAWSAWPAFAADSAGLLRQYASELLLHESQQALEVGKPLHYSDGEAGARLRAILEPSRTRQVLEAQRELRERGAAAPDLNAIMKPLARRYMQACKQWPSEYEPECLDVLNWVVAALTRNVPRIATPSPPAATASEARSSQALATTRRLLAGVLGVLERDTRQKAASGAFSAPGRERLLALADEMAQARGALAAAGVR